MDNGRVRIGDWCPICFGPCRGRGNAPDGWAWLGLVLAVVVAALVFLLGLL